MGFINQPLTGGPHIVGYMHMLSNSLAIQKIISPSSFFAPGTRATSVLSCVPMGRRCALTRRGSPIWYLDLEDAWRVLGFFFRGLGPLERPWNMMKNYEQWCFDMVEDGLSPSEIWCNTWEHDDEHLSRCLGKKGRVVFVCEPLDGWWRWRKDWLLVTIKMIGV